MPAMARVMNKYKLPPIFFPFQVTTSALHWNRILHSRYKAKHHLLLSQTQTTNPQACLSPPGKKPHHPVSLDQLINGSLWIDQPWWSQMQWIHSGDIAGTNNANVSPATSVRSSSPSSSHLLVSSLSEVAAQTSSSTSCWPSLGTLFISFPSRLFLY